ncbi:MAG: recombinase family protein [Pseudomonadota bacterium]|nr:recombinase family protein [Pseudomonadota bacterium]
MKPIVPKPQRCAIYTRKSTEHNLDLEFNSLDAQREACEAYIKSQAHEGWRLVPDRYDDGGLSGVSLDRAALQKLLADVRAGKITIVVVYKVDRLTRSLADFAKLVELFDQHGVSFVSITQSFNTTSSMGRLTLNVLLSFAQFEREVIGERVRDKIAASKRKGLWVGGPVSLGYRCIDKKLVVVPEEAEVVRLIFTRYLELGSMGALIAELDRQGIRTKVNGRRDGRRSGGIRFGVGSLAHLLKNRLYIGEVTYRGEVHRGEHEPILGRDVFEAVQAKRAANAVTRQIRLRGSGAILTGRLFDDRGSRMSPTHANKRGVRYRYYVSHAILQNRKAEAGNIARVPAPEIETLVCDSVRRHLAAMDAVEPQTVLADRDLIEHHVSRVIVKPQALEVCLIPACEILAQAEDPSFQDPAPRRPLTTTITLAWTAPSFAAVKGIVHAPCAKPAMRPESRDALLTAIAKARGWVDDIRLGRIASFAGIAEREAQGERHIRLLTPLAFLSPRIIAAIVDGTAPTDLTVSGLAKALPYSWIEQEHSIGL